MPEHMTRTARIGSKTPALSSTPWTDLKKGYKLLENPDCDTSDSSDVVSSASALGVSKREKLKTKKKTAQMVADKVKKMTRQDLEDTLPLLGETVQAERDHSVVKKRSKKSVTSDTVSSTEPVTTEKSIKSKKKTAHECPDDRVPLLPTDDMPAMEVESQGKRKRIRIRKAKPGSTKGQSVVDERRQKRIEARKLRRQRRKVCFNCRESGHHVSECTKSMETAGTGMCFKCGADNHSSKNCQARVAEGDYPYAKCFVCEEVGHLSRACPENPKGLYPHGGGCNLCGSVEHFKSNCPTRHQNQPKSQKGTVGRLKHGHSTGSVDAEEFYQHTAKTNTRTKKYGPKVVTF